MAQRREVPELKIVVALEFVMRPNRSEHLRLLHRVHTEIRLQIQIGLQEIGRIPGHLRNHRSHLSKHLIHTSNRSWLGGRRRYGRGGRGGGGCGVEAGAIADPLGNMAQRREVPKLKIVVAFEFVMRPNRSEHLRLLHRVHTEIRLQIQIGLQEIGRIPGHLRNHSSHLSKHLVHTSSALARGPTQVRTWRPWRRRVRGVEAGAIADPLGNMAQRREVPELKIVVAFEFVMRPNRSEHLRLLHRVHTEIRLQIQIGLQEIGRIPGHLRNHSSHLSKHLVDGGCRNRRSSDGGCRCDGRWSRRRGNGCRNGCGWRGGRGRCGRKRPVQRGAELAGIRHRHGRVVLRRGGRADVDHPKTAVVGLEVRAVVAGEQVEPALPGGGIDDAVGVAELVGRTVLAVRHRRPPEQRHRHL